MEKTKRARLPQLVWVQKGETTTGNPTWETRDGMFRLIHSTTCLGVAIPPRWTLWRYLAGRWHKVTESRGRDPVEKRARQLAAEYDDED
jgi:hypothetical protein